MFKTYFIGGIWPVVQRELREGARRPVNHRLRFLSAVVVTVVLWVAFAEQDYEVEEMGGYLLGQLHAFILTLIFVIVPGLTADCIAREKRDGTLGLLFLTPLSAGGIVAGKALVGALRAFTLWLAVLPILIIPFTTGGITWFDALSALSLEFVQRCFAWRPDCSPRRWQGSATWHLCWPMSSGPGYYISSLCLLPLSLALPTIIPILLYQYRLVGPNFELIICFSDSGIQGGVQLMIMSPALVESGPALFGLSAFDASDLLCCRPIRGVRVARSWRTKFLRPGAKVCSGDIARRYSNDGSGAICNGRWIGTPSPGCDNIPGKRALSKWGLCLVFLLIEVGGSQRRTGHS